MNIFTFQIWPIFSIQTVNHRLLLSVLRASFPICMRDICAKVTNKNYARWKDIRHVRQRSVPSVT